METVRTCLECGKQILIWIGSETCAEIIDERGHENCEIDLDFWDFAEEWAESEKDFSINRNF